MCAYYVLRRRIATRRGRRAGLFSAKLHSTWLTYNPPPTLRRPHRPGGSYSYSYSYSCSYSYSYSHSYSYTYNYRTLTGQAFEGF